MSRIRKIIFSIPRTLWFNFRYLPISLAMKLPIWIASNVKVRRMKRGCIVLNSSSISLGMIRIGYHVADAVDNYGTHTILDIDGGGNIIFEDDAHIGHGAILVVKSGATLKLGRHFAISGTTSIICNESVTFGNDVQTSWNSLITDSDAHKIFSEDGAQINPNKEIIIGNNIWIAANTTILKGSVISDNTVVASNSLVNKKFTQGKCIIGGSPATVIKNIESFEI